MQPQSCSIPAPEAAIAIPAAGRALDTNRTLRYDALLQLIEEVQRRQSLPEIASAVASRWKHCASTDNWRLVCVYEQQATLLIARGPAVTVQQLGLAGLGAYDAEQWAKRVPRQVLMPALGQQRENLPEELADPAGQGLVVMPVQQGTNTIALLSVLTCSGFDALDRKFNKLVGSTVAARVLAILTAQGMRESQARADREHAQAELLRATMDSAAMAMAIIDPTVDGAIRDVNQAFCALLGMDRAPLLAMASISELLQPPDQARLREQLTLLLDSRLESLSLELELLHPQGGLIPVQMVVAIMHAQDGAPRLGIVQIMDLTERHAVERMKEEFIATVSHELRTPIAAVIGAASLFAGRFIQNVPAKGNELIGLIQRNSQRLLLLINDLIDMEEIFAGEMQIECTPNPVQDLLDQLQANHAPAAQKAGVQLVVQGDATTCLVRANQRRLAQILHNLLSNAIKYSPRDAAVLIGARLHGDQIEFSLTDSGPGVPLDFRSQIFQKFKQADSSQSRSKGGTGLGLAISKQLTLLMDGQIGYESEPGQGARFWVRFARAEPIIPKLAAPLPG